MDCGCKWDLLSPLKGEILFLNYSAYWVVLYLIPGVYVTSD